MRGDSQSALGEETRVESPFEFWASLDGDCRYEIRDRASRTCSTRMPSNIAGPKCTSQAPRESDYSLRNLFDDNAQTKSSALITPCTLAMHEQINRLLVCVLNAEERNLCTRYSANRIHFVHAVRVKTALTPVSKTNFAG